jgi:hypothetical protein
MISTGIRYIVSVTSFFYMFNTFLTEETIWLNLRFELLLLNSYLSAHDQRFIDSAVTKTRMIHLH